MIQFVLQTLVILFAAFLLGCGAYAFGQVVKMAAGSDPAGRRHIPRPILRAGTCYTQRRPARWLLFLLLPLAAFGQRDATVIRTLVTNAPITTPYLPALPNIGQSSHNVYLYLAPACDVATFGAMPAIAIQGRSGSGEWLSLPGMTSIDTIRRTYIVSALGVFQSLRLFVTSVEPLCNVTITYSGSLYGGALTPAPLRTEKVSLSASGNHDLTGIGGGSALFGIVLHNATAGQTVTFTCTGSLPPGFQPLIFTSMGAGQAMVIPDQGAELVTCPVTTSNPRITLSAASTVSVTLLWRYVTLPTF